MVNNYYHGTTIEGLKSILNSNKKDAQKSIWTCCNDRFLYVYKNRIEYAGGDGLFQIPNVYSLFGDNHVYIIKVAPIGPIDKDVSCDYTDADAYTLTKFSVKKVYRSKKSMSFLEVINRYHILTLYYSFHLNSTNVKWYVKLGAAIFEFFCT